MRIIAFAWTTPALLAGEKTCTRRDWSPEYARRFKAGDLLAAYDHSPRVHGHQVATIRLTAAPEWSNKYPDDDYWNEGFDYLTTQGAKVDGITPAALWGSWVSERPYQWIVRFELAELAR